ncbi:MAG: sulfatase, partial [Planctomycetales bacterium]
PNILFCISDDQSYAHTGANGDPVVKTPAFDRVAREGVLFMNAFVPSPGCSPSRASMLTGRHTWQIEHAGTHASEFPKKYHVYPELLERNGYFVGSTGKSWGPGNWKISGRDRNPAGPDFNKRNAKPPHGGIRKTDYAANFKDFLDARPDGKPFCFWYGASEPHRSFEKGVGLKIGKKLADAKVPSFLPDSPEIRSDLLDYCVEIEWFDKHLGRMLQLLEDAGELENTLVIVTSDNGMAFPRAKANCFEYGIHVPLAVRWPKQVPSGRVVKDLVSLTDLAPTLLEAAETKLPAEPAMSGKSFLSVLRSSEQGQVDPARTRAFSARERHSSSRWNNLAYPQRAMRTPTHLYSRNFKPDRWPAGTPRKLEGSKLGPLHGGYHDIDACPSLTLLIQNRSNPNVRPLFLWWVDKRPGEELYDIETDPGCLKNLALDDSHAKVLAELRKECDAYLRKTGDPRALGTGDVFESYKRYSRIRKFPKPEPGVRVAPD